MDVFLIFSSRFCCGVAATVGAAFCEAPLLIGVSGTSNSLAVATPGLLAGCSTLDRFGVGMSCARGCEILRRFIGVSGTSSIWEANELGLLAGLLTLMGIAGESGMGAVLRAITGEEGGIIGSVAVDRCRKLEAEDAFRGVWPTTCGAEAPSASLWLFRGNDPGTAGPTLEGGTISSVEGSGMSAGVPGSIGMAFLKRGFAGVALMMLEPLATLAPFRGSVNVSMESGRKLCGKQLTLRR